MGHPGCGWAEVDGRWGREPSGLPPHPIAGSLPACTASHWPQRPRSLRPATPLYAQSWVNTKRKEEGRVALKRVNRRWSGGEGMARTSGNGKELPNAPFTRYMCPTFMSSAGPTRIYISFPLKSQSPFNFSQSRGIIKSAPQKVATKPRAWCWENSDAHKLSFKAKWYEIPSLYSMFC